MQHLCQHLQFKRLNNNYFKSNDHTLLALLEVWECIFLLVDCTKRRVILKGLFIFGPHSLVTLVSLQKEENVVFSWVDFSYSVQLHKIHLAPAEYHTTINCCLFNNVKLTHACWHTYPDYSVHYTHEEIIGREKFRKNATWEWSLCICCTVQSEQYIRTSNRSFKIAKIMSLRGFLTLAERMGHFVHSYLVIWLCIGTLHKICHFCTCPLFSRNCCCPVQRE